MDESYHIPVLSNTAVDLLINPELSGQIIVDGTLGGGGYSKLICSRLDGGDRLIAIDKDLNAIEYSRKVLADCNARLEIVNGNFGELKKLLSGMNVNKVTGVVLDLGLSSYQLGSEEGFSFMRNTRLDMRADKNDEITAAGILNSYTEKELSELFRNYGEIGNAKRLSSAVIARRKKKKFEMTFDLVETIDEEYTIGRRNRIDFLAKIFQALRIEVNREMENLKNVLSDSIDLLIPGGRLVLVSYHSLEDRIVKNFFRDRKISGELKILTKKPLIPANDEIRSNPRSRSAKLRAGEKI